MKKTHIKLPCFGMVVRLHQDADGWSGTLHSPQLKDPCPDCGKTPCQGDCRQAKAAAEAAVARLQWLQYSAAIDALESLIVAHACAGIDVQSPAYVEGIETAAEAIANHYD